MKILVACEESGVVRRAFRGKGHDAFSCDILPALDGSQFHIQGDAIAAVHSRSWDMLIAHPPCTYLCVPGAHYLHKQPDRWGKMLSARDFFMCLFNSDIPKRCIENPVPHRYAQLPPYSQIVHPWMFGHEVSKRTALWLVGLPPLAPTDIRENRGERYIRTERQQKLGYGRTSNSKWYAKASPQERSTTFNGIAEAMAEQWGMKP